MTNTEAIRRDYLQKAHDRGGDWQMAMLMMAEQILLLGDAVAVGQIAASELEILRSAARDVVLAYQEANPMRTADMHPAKCGCLRCEIDRLDHVHLHGPFAALESR